VVTEAGAEVHRPPAGRATPATRGRVVRHGGRELGQKAQRVDFRPVPRVTPIPSVGVPGAPAKGVPAEGVNLARARLVPGKAEVPEGQDVLLEPVTPVVVRLG